MHPAICLWFPARPNSLTPAATWFLSLALACFFASGLSAGVVPNSDERHSDNGANDPFYVNVGDSFTYFYVYDDDVLVMNGGTISNEARTRLQRSPIRLLNQSQAIINGGLIQDIDTSSVTWGFHMEDQSRLTINGGTFQQTRGSSASLLYASYASFAEVNGGDFHSVENPPVSTWFDGSVTINGGTFASDHDNVVEHLGDGLVTINGGTFSGPATGVVNWQGDLILRGGRFETDLDLLTSGGNTELIARSASLGGIPLHEGPITAAVGVIDVVWPNGAAESLRFQRQAGAIRLTLIPEPSTLLLVALAGFAALPLRRR